MAEMIFEHIQENSESSSALFRPKWDTTNLKIKCLKNPTINNSVNVYYVPYTHAFDRVVDEVVA